MEHKRSYYSSFFDEVHAAVQQRRKEVNPPEVTRITRGEVPWPKDKGSSLLVTTERGTYYIKRRSDDELPVLKNLYKPGSTRLEGYGRGVIYIGRLPFGFYENALDKFFSQFGKITRLRVARSKKNGKPMGWAFIEFRNMNVAKIAAATMNNYFLFGKGLKCEYIRPQRIQDSMFQPSGVSPSTCEGTIGKIRNRQAMYAYRYKSAFLRKKQSRINKALKFLKYKFGIDLKENQLSNTSDNCAELEKLPQKKLSIQKKELLSKKLIKNVKQNHLKPGRRNVSQAMKGFTKKRKAATKQKPIVMEISGIDEEITLKTPPNVVKKVKKAKPVGISDADTATTPKTRARERDSAARSSEAAVKATDKEISPNKERFRRRMRTLKRQRNEVTENSIPTAKKSRTEAAAKSDRLKSNKGAKTISSSGVASRGSRTSKKNSSKSWKKFQPNSAPTGNRKKWQRKSLSRGGKLYQKTTHSKSKGIQRKNNLK